LVVGTLTSKRKTAIGNIKDRIKAFENLGDNSYYYNSKTDNKIGSEYFKTSKENIPLGVQLLDRGKENISSANQILNTINGSDLIDRKSYKN